tara:strand:- start:29 stop:244 length:216 start_codon:yes stop_codon:yes gene_type:complete
MNSDSPEPFDDDVFLAQQQEDLIDKALEYFGDLPHEIQIIIVKQIVKSNVVVNSHLKYKYPDIDLDRLYLD